MYSQQELDDAVASGVISAEAADALRAHVERQRDSRDPGRRAVPALSPASTTSSCRSPRRSCCSRSAGSARASARRPASSSAIMATGPELPRSARGCRDRLGPRAVLHRASAGWRCRRSCCCWPSSAASLRPPRFAARADHRPRPLQQQQPAARRRSSAASAPRSPPAPPGCTGAASTCRSPSPPAPPRSPALFVAIVVGIVQPGQMPKAAKNVILGFVLLLGDRHVPVRDVVGCVGPRAAHPPLGRRLLAAPARRADDRAPDLHAARPDQRHASASAKALVVVGALRRCSA